MRKSPAFPLRTFGLRARFALYGAALATAIVVALTTLSYVGARQIVRDHARHRLDDALAAIATSLRQSLDVVGREVGTLAAHALLVDSQRAGGDDASARSTALQAFLASHELPVGIDYELVLADARGEAIAARRAPHSYGGADWFKAVIEQGRPYAGIERRGASAALVVAAAFGQEEALILSTDLGSWFGGRQVPIPANLGIAAVELLADDGAVVARHEIAPARRSVALAVPIRSTVLAGTPLSLRVSIDEAELEAPLDALLARHLALGLLAIVLAGTAGAALAGRQTRRIERLAAEAQHIEATGQTMAALDVARFGRDEIGTLAATLAGLFARLKAHQEDLDALVVRRTSDLHRREAELRRAQAIARVGSWSIDSATQSLHWSEESYRMFGLDPATPVDYERFIACVHPDDRALVDAAWLNALDGMPYDIEHRIVVGGATAWVREQAELQFGPEGQLLSGVGTVQDVTGRRYAEEQLRQLSTAVEQSPASIVMTDLDGTIRYVNPQFERITGYSAEEAIGKNPRILKSGRMPAQEYAALWATISAGQVWRGEFENLRKDGSPYWEIASISPIHEADGRLSGYVAVKEDVSVRKQHERALREREAKLSALIRSLPDTLFVIDADRRISEFHAPDGDNAGDMVGRPYAEAFPAGLSGPLAEALAGIAADGGSRQFEYSLDERSGPRHYSASASLMDLADGSLAGFIVVARDVTERRRNEARMREALVVFNASSQGIMTTDANGAITSINPAFSAITGYSGDEVIGHRSSMFKSGRPEQGFHDAMWAALAAGDGWEGEIRNRRKSGETYPQWLTVSAVRDSGGEVIEYVWLFSDITQRKQQEEAIWRQANFDALTGLANRNLLHDRLERALARARRSAKKVGLLFLDLDGFKWINDTLGHDVGDELLVEVARRLKAAVREQDTVARLGGDEFTVVANDLDDAEHLHAIGEKLLGVLRQPFTLGGAPHHLSASIGITVFPDDGEAVQTLFKNADIAMYKSKQAGKDRIHFYAHHMQADAQARMRLEADLRTAIADSQFVLHYQPIIAAGNGETVAAEALIRWQHPQRGLIGPGEFIPVAEESGLIVAIGEWALREAAQQWRTWHSAGLGPLRVAVNVSGVQFREASLPATIAAVLAEHRIERGSLVLEITESVLMDGSAAAEFRMHDIRAQGIGYALDDFGTGYSSLSYLKRFPVDSVKIDRSFVDGCADDRNDALLVKAIVNMAHSLDLRVTAEGVETVAQMEFLRAIGCDTLQGYLFSRPVAAAEFARLLGQGRLLPA